MGKSAVNELKLAIAKLQTHVKKTKEKKQFLHGGKEFSFNIIPLAKLVGRYVAAQVSDKKLQTFKNEKKDLIRAIDVIKIHHRLINRLSRGTEEEASFAEVAHKTIEEYNTLLSEQLKKPDNLGERITQFFSNQASFSIDSTCKLFLPRVSYKDGTRSKKAHCSAIDLFDTLPLPPKREAVDLFRMKVIRNIEEKKLLSIGATLRAVRSCPIDTVIQQESATVSLKQTCIPLPGETLEFSALYDERRQTNGIPIGDISYSLTSEQTGFPDPALTSGWGLAESFIPSLPLRPELAPTLDLLLDRKREVALALLPQGILNHKAKFLYEGQKKLYSQDPTYFITHHKETLLTILKLLNATTSEIEFIKQAFQKLKKKPPSYDQLPIPYRLLQTFYDEAQELENFSEDDNLKIYLENLFNEQLEKIEDPLTALLLKYLNPLAITFFLQANSEKFSFAPPTLTPTEQRIQSVVFFQQVYFFQQLEKPQELLNEDEAITSLHFYFDNILGLLKGTTPSPLSNLANVLIKEVNTYYHIRHKERG